MSRDVVLELPGTSTLAGTYRGTDEVGRFMSQLRWVLGTGRHEVSFEHDGDQMLIRHQVAVRGPQHVAGMVLFQRFTFDAPSGKIVSSRSSRKTAGSSIRGPHGALGRQGRLRSSATVRDQPDSCTPL